MSTQEGPGLTDRAKEAAGQGTETTKQMVSEQASKVEGKVAEQVDRGSTQVGGQIRSFGEALNDTAFRLRQEGNERPAQAAERVGEQIQRLGDRVAQSSGDELVQEVESFIRRQPLVAAAAMFVVGMAAARVLKASGESRASHRGYGYESSWSSRPATYEGTADWSGTATTVESPGTSELTGARYG